MEFEKYKNMMAYPKLSDYTTKEEYKNATHEYRKENGRLFEEFKKDLFADLDITDNPKAEKLFSIAWEKGHSSGYREVYNEALDLVDLIK